MPASLYLQTLLKICAVLVQPFYLWAVYVVFHNYLFLVSLLHIFFIFLGERSPKLSDRNDMPFTMCVVTELLRMDVATLSLDHCAAQDVVIQGHKIPKGRQISNYSIYWYEQVLKKRLPYDTRKLNRLKEWIRKLINNTLICKMFSFQWICLYKELLDYRKKVWLAVPRNPWSKQLQAQTYITELGVAHPT